MLQDRDRIFKNLYGTRDWRLAGARRRGAWDGTKGFLEKGQDWIIEEVKASGLRGRGGAGFPTGLKWSFMPKNDSRPSYLVVNADESEPGTCKDREILRHDPHLFVEGCLYAGFAMKAHTCYIYVRGEYIRERERLQAAIDEAYEAKLIGKNNVHGWDFDVYVSHGRAPISAARKPHCSKAWKARRASRAPEAAISRQCGLYGAPTTVNNVESIAVVPDILRRAQRGSRRWGGPTITAPNCSAFRPCERAVQCSKRKWASAARAVERNMRAACAAAGTICCRDSRRLVALHLRPASQCQDLLDGFRFAARVQFGPRHGGCHRDGQVHRHREGHRAHRYF